MSIWQATLRIAVTEAVPASVSDGARLSDALTAMVGDPSSPWATREEALGALLAMERDGAVRIEGADDSDALAELCALVDQLDATLATDPGLHNVVGDHRAWSEDPEHYDFVEAATDLGRLKRFERDLYLSHLAPYLDALPEGARILDAGCGPGRFVSHMLRRGFSVHLVDAAPDALHRALAHGLDAGGGADTLDGHVADVDALDAFEDGTFDAVLSMEVICYQGDPLRALRELARVTKPGGVIMLSVEGLYGALMTTEGASPGELGAALSDEKISISRDVHVTYYTAESLTTLLREAGLEPVLVTGCHYVPEGPFGRTVDVAQLDDEAHRREILSLEATCAANPVLRPLARAWLAVGRRR
jgi:SAM-dependent methyltransferase